MKTIVAIDFDKNAEVIPKKNATMRVLDLFAGIGGFSLGLERAGMEIVGQCEIEPFPLAVLAKHWPNIWRHDDVKTLTSEIIFENCGQVDLVCGGFPCTDISNSGKCAGIAGPYSSLWKEMLRCICVVRRGLLENVAALLNRGMGEVLGDLAKIGNDAEWDCIPACDLGADIIRDRVFIYTFPHIQGREVVLCGVKRICFTPHGTWGEANSLDTPNDRANRIEERLCEPAIFGSADGIPKIFYQDRLKGCGNSIVPQVSELIGRWILSNEGYSEGSEYQP